MTDIIVHHIGHDNSWAFVETKGIRFEVGLTHDEDGLSSVTFSPVELTEEDMNLIEDQVNVEPVVVGSVYNPARDWEILLTLSRTVRGTKADAWLLAIDESAYYESLVDGDGVCAIVKNFTVNEVGVE